MERVISVLYLNRQGEDQISPDGGVRSVKAHDESQIPV